MKHIAIVAALVAVAACSKGDKNATTDTTAVGGAVAPASDSSSGSMSSGSSMSGSAKDSSSMSSGAMGSDSSAKSGVKNQTQSGMTDSSGNSTLGPNATKLSPTSGAAVTAKGDTLKKKTSPR